MFELRFAVAVVAVTMGSTATADIINVGPGDSIQAAIADPGTVDGDEIVVAPAPTSRRLTSSARRSRCGVPTDRM